jgi:hypothetical protein
VVTVPLAVSLILQPQSVQFCTDAPFLAWHDQAVQAPTQASVSWIRVMVTLAIIGLLVGAALSLYLRVFALVPALLFMFAVAAIVGMLRGETAWWAVGAMAAVGISVQLGYFGGSVLRQARPIGHSARPIKLRRKSGPAA